MTLRIEVIYRLMAPCFMGVCHKYEASKNNKKAISSATGTIKNGPLKLVKNVFLIPIW